MVLSVHVVSGPIGAGKSSILHAVTAMTQYERSVEVIPEDISAWQYYLEKFYERPGEYAFLFQKEVEVHMHNLTKRLEQLEEECHDKEMTVFVERAPSDVLEVFLPLNKDKIPPEDYAALVYCMTKYAERPIWQNVSYYMVVCPAHQCIQRIMQRDRRGESAIGEQYMVDMIQLYDSMAEKYDARLIRNYGRRNSLVACVSIVTQCLHPSVESV